MLGGRVRQNAIDDAGAVEPGHHRESPGDSRGLEVADLLHPADVQLQVRPPGNQRAQPAPGAPGEVAAQVRLTVFPGGAREPGQVPGHCQPQLISGGRWMIGRDGGKNCGVHHAETLRPPPAARKPANVPGVAWAEAEDREGRPLRPPGDRL
jgi:hypothetical protein